MSLQLDARQRAMLAEMGIRLFDAPQADAAVVEGAGPARSVPGRAPQGAAAAPHEATAAVHAAAPANVTAPGRAAAPALPQRTQAVPVASPARPVADALRPAGVGSMDWAELEAAVGGCAACKLCHARRNPVFGVGPQQADWMVIGEAPGEQEDLAGEPFVGPSGKLLDNMLAALGLNRRSNVYIANVLKCRPPNNRNPEPEEVAQCEPFLRRQVELLQPKIILAMGRFAVQSLLQTTEPVGKLRGRVHTYNGVPVVVTYHPAYLLRNLPDKAKAWADLCLAREIAG